MRKKLSTLKGFIISLNHFYNKVDPTIPPLSYRKSDLLKYYRGLQFSNFILWKIYIINGTNYTPREKVILISKIPDPNGYRFISIKLAYYLYKKSYKLKRLFRNSNMYGGCNISNIPIKKLIFSPLQLAEEKLGSFVSVPLEITSGLVGAFGTISQLMASTVSMLPPFPGFSTGTSAISSVLEVVHVASNSFNIFLNIGRSDWDMVIQSAIGMFPQFLEAINGMSMTLTSLNKFMEMFDNMLGILNNKSDIIIPMILPIITNPLRFANPFYLKTYAEFHISNFIKKNRALIKIPNPTLNKGIMKTIKPSSTLSDVSTTDSTSPTDSSTSNDTSSTDSSTSNDTSPTDSSTSNNTSSTDSSTSNDTSSTDSSTSNDTSPPDSSTSNDTSSTDSSTQ